VGLITRRQNRADAGDDRGHARVADVALPLGDVPTAAPGQPLIQILEGLEDSTGGRILVLDGQDLVGIITQADVARAIDIRTLSPGGDDGPDPERHDTRDDVSSR
jgi:CBS domain-containing protein